MLQLDNTRIAIRERSHIDILDLAIRVIRVYAWPLAVALAVGVAPMMLLNYWLLADYREPDFDLGFPGSYMWYMMFLVVWEIPLATAPLTLYLGQALFVGRPEPRKMARDFVASLPQLIIYQVLVRAVMVPVIFTWFFLFAWWPYLNEVILLDRNPMRAKTPDAISTYRRCRTLHAGQSGDFFARWLGSLVVAALLFLSTWFSIAFVRELLVGEQASYLWWMFLQWDQPMFLFYFPLALWLVVGYFTVVRFLGYLDLRICREGWEVELKMRAEEARLNRQLT